MSIKDLNWVIGFLQKHLDHNLVHYKVGGESKYKEFAEIYDRELKFYKAELVKKLRR